MKPTIESLAAYSLGYNMQILNWKAFQDDYAERKADMAQSLKELDFDLDLPTDLDAFVSERDAITVLKWKEIYESLEETTDRGEDVANVLERILLKHV